jgi:hypothetical protein
LPLWAGSEKKSGGNRWRRRRTSQQETVSVLGQALDDLLVPGTDMARTPAATLFFPAEPACPDIL